MNVKMRVMTRAVKTRIKNGETLQEILDSYPRLTDAEKKEIRQAVTNG